MALTILMKDMQHAMVPALRQALAGKLGAVAESFPGLAKGGDLFDADVDAAARRWQSGVGIQADGVIGPYCMSLLGLVSLPAPSVPLTVDAVRQLFPETKPSNIARFLPYVAAALCGAKLTDRPMIVAAMGTIRAETEGFVPIPEFPSKYNTKPGMAPFSAYDGRLGNKALGEGARYRGRGFVQLTGRDNYHTYSATIGIDIEANPDLALGAEVAAVLLAVFLADHADAMRKALAAGNYAKARSLVNGGSYGLDKFRDVFRRADTVWPQASVGAGGTRRRGAAAKAAFATAGATAARQFTAGKDPVDLRDRAYMPPPASLNFEWPTDEKVKLHLTGYCTAGLVLDQGQEGACTGFGLACVINFLRWVRGGCPKKMASVSPRMLYNFARRYDEYAGENYEGSSCRGALKGWYYNGVCMEDDWPYTANDSEPPKFGYIQNATRTTLGVYYRIDLQSITDIQAAIQEVGAVYVSANTHEGWQNVATVRRVTGHASVPQIAFDGRASHTDGHAFALVGFNEHGFVVQNSWGQDWGARGFAILTYADWLANAMDAWVFAMGVPGVLFGAHAAGRKAVARAGIDKSRWWDVTAAYEHGVVLGNDARVNRYLPQDALTRSLQYQACTLPDAWFRAQPGDKKRLVIYAHGGLNSEDDAITRTRAMGPYFLGNGCYPLFMIWKTGMLESIGDIIVDKFRRGGPASGIREAITDATDALIESTIGRPFARPVWTEMKENAQWVGQPTRGGDLLVTALQNLYKTWGDQLEVHLVGHSAGSIFLGWLLDLLAFRGLEKLATSLHLYAPACTVQFANQHFAPHDALLENTYMDILSDKNERDDQVAEIYRKSLLYMVSDALEMDVRTPILGMDNTTKPAFTNWDGSASTGEALANWRQTVKEAGLGKRTLVVDTDKVPMTSDGKNPINASHGSFDNNVEVVSRTLQRITGKSRLAMPVDDLRGF
ncbi:MULTISPECIES: C1 family peptidase [Dyella]|uniref:Peptidase C1 n=2 Tax=Dyella TaxID=231454 RepID=A0A4R0YLW3_9GAMM|nr:MULTISPECIES: C1 family peptidase [Dyella]TBR36450.1 peptidase C1 [Dyella terrae]TCI08458.1 peptidase C1 [Dyella soli]